MTTSGIEARQASGRTSHQIRPDDRASWSRAIETSATTSSASRGAATGVAISAIAASISSSVK